MLQDTAEAERKGLRQKVGHLENRLNDLHAAMVSLRRQHRSSSSEGGGDKASSSRSSSRFSPARSARSSNSRPSPARSVYSVKSLSTGTGFGFGFGLTARQQQQEQAQSQQHHLPVMQLVCALMQIAHNLGLLLVQNRNRNSRAR